MCIVCTEEQVIASLSNQGCDVTLDHLPNSHLCETGGQYFFIPKATIDGGYTQAQLDKIEQTAAAFGIDILPLDHHIN